MAYMNKFKIIRLMISEENIKCKIGQIMGNI
jgi:hypothetical protein